MRNINTGDKVKIVKCKFFGLNDLEGRVSEIYTTNFPNFNNHVVYKIIADNRGPYVKSMKGTSKKIYAWEPGNNTLRRREEIELV